MPDVDTKIHIGTTIGGRSNCNAYGGLYQWDEAMQYLTAQSARGICPPGWHIPNTYGEFQTLSASVSGDGNTLKAIGQGSDSGAGTNTSGFGALLAGHHGDDGTFYGLGQYMVLWSSNQIGAWGADAMCLHDNDTIIQLYSTDKNSGFSVRCLKD
jgi:uncharacterized protein (TIGR02145 family)